MQELLQLESMVLSMGTQAHTYGAEMKHEKYILKFATAV